LHEPLTDAFDAIEEQALLMQRFRLGRYDELSQEGFTV